MGRELRKQCCAFSAGGRFHKAWVKNGSGERSQPKAKQGEDKNTTAGFVKLLIGLPALGVYNSARSSRS